MTQIVKTQSTVYSVDQMIELISDFKSYPLFLPFCHRAESKYISTNQVYGTLHIAKGPFKRQFTTHNTLLAIESGKRIDMQLVEGGFKSLNGYWQVNQTDKGCDITLNLNFEISGGLLSNALSAIFEVIAKSMVDAFCDRAKVIYG